MRVAYLVMVLVACFGMGCTGDALPRGPIEPDDYGQQDQALTAGATYYSSNYTDWDALSTAIGAGEVWIIVDDSLTFDSNENTTPTIPSTVTLTIEPTGELSVNSGVTVTIECPLLGRKKEIFAGAGTVEFGTGYIGDVYAEWFGAIGDGSNDDTAALGRAIGAASTVRLIPGANYLVTDTISIPSNVSIIGQGTAMITFSGTMAAERVFLLDGVSNILLSGIRFVGDVSASASGNLYGNAVTILGGSDSIEISDCNIEAFPQAGIAVDESTRVKILRNRIGNIGHSSATSGVAGIRIADESDNAIVDSNVITDIAGLPTASIGHGLLIVVNGSSSAVATRFRITNNFIKDCGTHGIVVYDANSSDANGGVIAGNTIDRTGLSGGTENRGSGIYVLLVGGVEIVGNTIRDSHNNQTASGSILQGGIAVSTGSGNEQPITIADNTIENSAFDGIVVQGAYGLTVTGNLLREVSERGIHLRGCNDYTVTGNTINANEEGVFVSAYTNGSVNGAVTGNSIHGPTTGIYLYQITNAAVAGNSIDSYSARGAYTNGCINVSITGNTFYESTEAVLVYESRNAHVNTIFANNSVPQRSGYSSPYIRNYGTGAHVSVSGSAVPNHSTWAKGDTVRDTSVGRVGWVCTTAGTPGTWRSYGAIDGTNIAPADITASGDVTVGGDLSITAGDLILNSGGYVQLSLSTGTPPSADCNSAAEAGRIVADDSTFQIYICSGTGGWL